MRFMTHSKEDPIYVFPEMKLRGLVPNSYIHVSASELYIGGPIVGTYKSLTDAWTYRNWERRNSFISGIFVKEFLYSVFAIFQQE